MSSYYEVVIFYRDTAHELFSRGHTADTAGLWHAAGLDLSDYNGKSAGSLHAPVARALKALTDHASHWRDITGDLCPDAGSYDTTVAFLEAVERACVLFPDEIVWVSR